MDKDAAFRELFDEYRDRIYRMCCSYVSDPQDRKDVYQETLLNLWKGLEGFRGESALSTWIYRVTVNTALSYLSRRKARRERRDALGEYERTRLALGEGGVRDEDVERLYRAIAKLPLIDMIIMSLVLEDAGSAEIAKTTGLTEGNVRVRVHRAKARLKTTMERETRLQTFEPGRDGES